MEPLTRIEDIAHIRFAAPDLAEMRGFLDEFGLITREDDGRLYGSGRDGAPFAHVTEPGAAAFLALGLRAVSVDDVHRIAEREGTAVEPLAAPGGGVVTRLIDPDGITVEVVAGQAWGKCAVLAHEPVRVDAGPSTILRLGHCVLNVSDFRTSEAW